MCGIVGILGKEQAAPLVLESLKRLEYRGYDSAGIATLNGATLERCRAEGKLANLAAALQAEPLSGTSAIGHTRWATHGAPTERNAHPHVAGRVAVVHNGIIENFKDLRDALEKDGAVFETDTDTEVVAQLINSEISSGAGPVKAVEATLAKLKGAFALAILIEGESDLMIGARRGSPLVVGYGDGEMYLGSDAIALASLTRKVCYLEEGDWAILTRTGAEIRDAAGRIANREVKTTLVSAALVDKGEHRHFMAKEIFEQPEAIGHTLGVFLKPATLEAAPPPMPFALEDITALSLSACGTAFYTCMVGKYWIERLARIPVDLDIASEFRYREPPLVKGGMALFVSQSGETADTLAALRYCKEQDQRVAAIVNVPESSIAREADVVFPTHAGPEIAVASTKATTCQLSVLAAFAIALARAKGTLSRDAEIRLSEALLETPRLMSEILTLDKKIAALGADVAKARDVFYLARGALYPIALEGALKLKEISYIHAEGTAAGELKHGQIALIDENVPVVVLAPFDSLFEKTISNMEEVISRGGKVILISDEKGIAQAGGKAWASITMPGADPFVAPILYTAPVQMLAYHTAVARGTDVDQPRNLAKSVTVE